MNQQLLQQKESEAGQVLLELFSSYQPFSELQERSTNILSGKETASDNGSIDFGIKVHYEGCPNGQAFNQNTKRQVHFKLRLFLSFVSRCLSNHMVQVVRHLIEQLKLQASHAYDIYPRVCNQGPGNLFMSTLLKCNLSNTRVIAHYRRRSITVT